MLIPYNTDAPLYHIPVGTVGLIAVNAVVFFGFTMNAAPSQVEPWMLQFGKGIHPIQWETNNFLHADIIHILGNMIFLWGFGLVVEGKLGWWRFVPLYLLIGAIYGAIVQIGMLDYQGQSRGALGASGVIFGLMMISLVWAPKNEMSCAFILFLRPIMVDVPITVFATTYFIWQGVAAWLTGFSMSSAMLHLVGGVVGAAFGVALLKLGWVDCEGWDLFSIIKGREGVPADKLPAATEGNAAPPPEVLDEKLAQFLASAVRNRLRTGDAAGAVQFYQKQRELHPAWTLAAADLMALVQSLHQKKLWSESVGPMFDYLRQFPKDSLRARLKLAQILIDSEHRPGKALRLLAKIDRDDVPAELRAAHLKLVARAEQMKAESGFELADEADV